MNFKQGDKVVFRPNNEDSNEFVEEYAELDIDGNTVMKVVDFDEDDSYTFVVTQTNDGATYYFPPEDLLHVSGLNRVLSKLENAN